MSFTRYRYLIRHKDWEFHQMQGEIELHQCRPHCFFGSVCQCRNEKGDSVNASYYHIVNPSTNTIVGVEVTHSFSTNVNTITVGTQHALDPLTTIKARVNNTGKVSALIQHEWRLKSLFTIFGKVDTKSIDKSP
ncbi:hypothetical protein Golob_022918 [Gossypium lobatum]|uniref:Uncharacterized protein n=1 Tax=Gossypium lobatum TaxID=34289 RepID=A0A7J8LHZ0_9ROSI|nr:hypothetical protein [Gossypium lobatum]